MSYLSTRDLIIISIIMHAKRRFSVFKRLMPEPKDINQQIRELDERKVKVTFKDIWQDYRNFRSAYYFRQLPTPKEVFEKHEVQVDTKNFRMAIFLVDLFKNHKNPPRGSVSNWFTHLVLIMAVWFGWRIGRKPFEWYYHWDDPLKPDDDTPFAGVRAQDIRERLRYKTKARDWRNIE